MTPNPDPQPNCEHEYEAVDAGPYSDDIFYIVCKNCGREKPADPQGGESNMNNIAIRCDHGSFIGEIQGNRLSVIPLLKKGCGCGGEFHDDDCKCSCTDYRRDPLCTMHTEGATTQPTPASERKTVEMFYEDDLWERHSNGGLMSYEDFSAALDEFINRNSPEPAKRHCDYKNCSLPHGHIQSCNELDVSPVAQPVPSAGTAANPPNTATPAPKTC
jgi:hypothetical protein